MAGGVRAIFPEAETECRPIADGGEGTASALCASLGGEWVTRQVRGPLGEPVEAGYAWVPGAAGGPLAVVEMCAASGLELVPEGGRRPLEATTYGTGELLRAAIERGAARIIVGLGGSATTDGGAGAAAALGYRFHTGAGVLENPSPATLRGVTRIEAREHGAMPEILAACDVGNPLLGPRGAAAVFGPQKGASPGEIATLEAALAHLAHLAVRDLAAPDHRETPGAGAAGGLGYGLLTFCNARMCPGFELVAEIIGLEEAIRGADLVFTGEGSLDAQTLEGKGPAGVAALARKWGKPVIAFAGRAGRETGLDEVFDAVLPLADAPLSLEAALRDAPLLLQRAAQRAAALLRVGGKLGR